MINFNYDDIDLYDYHMINYYFSRLHSILNYGIVSTNYAKENQIPSFSRNYSNPSNANDYISIFEFSRTIFMYGGFINELYEYAQNRIVFIMKNLPILAQQSPKNPHYRKSIREIYVKDIIKPDQILGIAIRFKDANTRLEDYRFHYDINNPNNFICTCLIELQFLNELVPFDYTEFYTMIGKYTEASLKDNKESEKDCLTIMKAYVRKKVVDTIKTLLKKDNITMIDVLNYFIKDRYPIYLLGKFDIIELNKNEKLNNTPPFEVTKEQKELGKKLKQLNTFEKRNMKNMSEFGYDFYTEKIYGPITEEDSIILKRVLDYKKEIGLK